MDRFPANIDRALILSGGGARGAYQIGVWKFLSEIEWAPNLICGTSVGAINACAIGSGLSATELERFWQQIEHGQVYQYSFWRKIIRWLTRKGYTPVFDTKPLRKFLADNIDIPNLRTSEINILISAIGIIDSALKFFDNDEIGIDHIMASSAIPVLFPWQYIDGQPHWDGGVMANTPILPALQLQAKEIIVVLLSPVGGIRSELPSNRGQAIELLVEQSLLASYQSFLTSLNWQQNLSDPFRREGFAGFWEALVRKSFASDRVKIHTVSPSEMLGLRSTMNFSKKQAAKLLEAGYRDAQRQLKDLKSK